jgi:hypothetical protein
MNNSKLSIELSRNEALVFFEFLTRFNQKDWPEIFEDQAEQRVLWDIESILQKELVEPFNSDYQEIIKQARETIRGEK